MDLFSYKLGKNAGGGGTPAVLIDKNITENGTYNASSDSADGYRSVVVNVSGGGSYAPQHITFQGYNGTNQQLAQDMANLDIRNITSMRSMFSSQNGPDTVNTSNWNTQNVTNMAFMFSDSGLSTIILGSNFNTSNVTDMNGMFGYNTQITSLDLSSFDTSKVDTFSGMFAECMGLTGLLDLSSFTVGDDIEEIYVGEMLPDPMSATSLTGVDLSNFDFTKASSDDIFCLCGYSYGDVNYPIYVKDQTQKNYLEQNNPYLKNVQIKGA